MADSGESSILRDSSSIVGNDDEAVIHNLDDEHPRHESTESLLARGDGTLAALLPTDPQSEQQLRGNYQVFN